MALKLNERYPQRWDSPSNDYPQGAFKNLTELGEQDGSYLEQDWLNDYSGFFGALLRNAEMTPNGTIDTAQRSQFYDALVAVAKKSVTDALNKKWDIQATTGTGNIARMSEVEKKMDDGAYGISSKTKQRVYPEDFTEKSYFGYMVGDEIDGVKVWASVLNIPWSDNDNGLQILATSTEKNHPSLSIRGRSGGEFGPRIPILTRLNISQYVGSSTTAVMSQKAVTDQLNAIESGHGLGYGQSWVDVTSERVAGTTYTNNTGKPIVVNISVYATHGFYVDGLLITKFRGTNDTDTMSVVVPNNSNYRVGDGNSIDIWAELR